MKRYFTKPRDYCGDIEPEFYVSSADPPIYSAITVYQPEGSYNTGLVNEAGDALYVSSGIKMGFIK